MAELRGDIPRRVQMEMDVQQAQAFRDFLVAHRQRGREVDNPVAAAREERKDPNPAAEAGAVVVNEAAQQQMA